MRLVLFLLALPAFCQPNPAAPPNVFIDTTYQVPSGATVTLGPGDDLQAAINAAAPGDQIVLQAGASWVGNYTLPAKTCSPMVTIRTSALSSFPEGVRATPAQVASMASIISPNVAPAIATANAACGYQLVGLEVTMQPGATGNFGLIVLGSGMETAPNLPDTIFFARGWIHGLANLECKRGIQMNGKTQAIIDSTVTEIHTMGIDTQAVEGWAGPGPFKVVNNELQAGSEIVNFGGAVPTIVNTIPSDIEIRRNHLTRPTSWIGAGWKVKNFFELKNAQRVLFDSNLCEYNWIEGQTGYGILFQGFPNDSGSWATVRDVTFTNNTIAHSANGIATCGGCYAGMTDSRALRIYIYNNIFDDLGNPAETLGMSPNGVALLILTDTEQMTIDHNTFINYITPEATSILDGAPSLSIWITSNIFGFGMYGIFGNGTGDGTPAINMYLPGSVVSGNLLIDRGTNTSPYPAGNTFPSTWASIQFVNLNNGNGGNYQLQGGSPYIASGYMGAIPGAIYATPGSNGTRITGHSVWSGHITISH